MLATVGWYQSAVSGLSTGSPAGALETGASEAGVTGRLMARRASCREAAAEPSRRKPSDSSSASAAASGAAASGAGVVAAVVAAGDSGRALAGGAVTAARGAGEGAPAAGAAAVPGAVVVVAGVPGVVVVVAGVPGVVVVVAGVPGVVVVVAGVPGVVVVVAGVPGVVVAVPAGWPPSLRGRGRSSSSPAGWPLCPQTARVVSSAGCWLSSWARRWPPLSSAGCLARTRWTGSLAALKRHRKRWCRRLWQAMLLSRWQARWPGHDRSRPRRPPAAGPLCAPGSACRRAAFWRRAWGRDRFPLPANYPRGSRSPKSRHHSVACGFCELVGERHRKFRRPSRNRPPGPGLPPRGRQ